MYVSMMLCYRFNLIAFSRSCSSWKPGLVDPTEENCHDAAQWIACLVADGNTCTLEALQVHLPVNWFHYILGNLILYCSNYLKNLHKMLILPTGRTVQWRVKELKQ